MTRRRIARTLGAAVGGLLGASYLPAAFAFADDIVITPDNTELVSGFYGLHNVTAPPAVPGTVQGEQLFTYTDETTNQTGTFYGYESIDQAYRGDDLYLVAQDQDGATNPLNPGSVIETETSGPHNETIYSDLTSATGGKDVSTETTVNAYGIHTYHDSFDPSQYLTDKYLDSNVPLGTSGYEFVPTGDENVTAVNGLEPLDIDAQGTQEFNLVNSSGDVVGSFDAVQTNTGDTFGNYTEQLLVTQDLSGTQGTAPGDVPTVGSVYNIFYHNSPDRYSLYSDIPDNGKDNISYINVDNGHEHVTDAKSDLDAVKAEDLNKFEVPSENYTMTPTTDTIQDFSGVNGIPPYDNAVQGYEQFDVDNSSGQQIGVVDADVTNIIRSDGHFSEAVLVTGVESGTPGTGTGDVPPVGSVFDMVTHGSGQNYLIYSDMPSQSGDVISKYSVKADGAAHALPSKLDLAAGLDNDKFVNPFPVEADASAASSLDTSALASSLDPSGAVSPDSVTDSLLHSGALLDPFPHIEAALQFLTGLF